MIGLAALPAGRTDEHDVPGRCVRTRLSLHLCDGVLDQSEDTVEIDRQGGAPLLVGHALDGNVFRRPDSVVGHENVEASEMADRLGHQRPCGLRIVEIARDRVADRRAAILRECVCRGTSTPITEHNLGTRGREHADRGGADAARTAGDQSYLARERKRDRHSRVG